MCLVIYPLAVRFWSFGIQEKKSISRHYKNVHFMQIFKQKTLKLCDIGDLHTSFLSKGGVWKSRYIPAYFH